MGDVTFSVEARDGRGKGASRKLRQRGLVPGVVYGGGREATPIALDVAQFERLIETSHGGINTLIDLSGSSPAAGRTVIAKELQREAVRGRITHVDFYEVDLKTKIEVEVPIHLVGTPEGVTLGGVLDQQLREILLMCLPGSIPDDIQADVSGLQLGDSLHISDLQVPAGVEIHSEPTLTVATVLVPRGLKDAGEEGAEGEAPATEAAPAS
ncbi:MAG TPA: 50S ribosomal protein L25 [Myxococcota bacterium]|nr:50S ribosomal protein L25 [Myxococcota bacterium]